MINAIPNKVGILGICLKKILPKAVTRTMPAPDQTAYATPTGTSFTTKDR